MNPYPKGDVRYVETLDGVLRELQGRDPGPTPGRSTATTSAASNGQLAIVGDFDEAEVSKLSAELFGDWKSPATYERIPQQFQDVAPTNESLETPDKANAYFVAGQNLKLRDDDPDYPALILGNFMLGVSDTARLYVRIREKDGLSYGVGSQLSASPLDASGAFTAFAIYAPQNAARLEAAFREELARVLGEVFAAKEVAEAKSGWLQSRQISARPGRDRSRACSRSALSRPHASRGTRSSTQEVAGADRRTGPRRDAPAPGPRRRCRCQGRRLREGRRPVRRRRNEIRPPAQERSMKSRTAS